MTNFQRSSRCEPSANDVQLAYYWAEFNATFPTEEDCVEALCQRTAEDETFKCSYCGSLMCNKKYGERVSRCLQCFRHNWHTSGTMFERVRLCRAWLAAIWLMERGVALSSSRFHKLLNIAQSSALNILHKVRAIVHEHMPGNARLMPSANFSALFIRRSALTPTNAHPRSEEEAAARDEIASLDVAAEPEDFSHRMTAEQSSGPPLMELPSRTDACMAEQDLAGDPVDRGAVVQIADGVSVAGDLNGKDHVTPVGRLILDCFSNQPLSGERLCQLTGIPVAELAASLLILELSNLVVRQPGDFYLRTRSARSSGQERGSPGLKDFPEVTLSTVSSATQFVIEHNQGISRKYLQNYLAAYWCYNDRENWMPGTLLNLCRGSRAIKDSEIRSYVSPVMVKCPI